MIVIFLYVPHILPPRESQRAGLACKRVAIASLILVFRLTRDSPRGKLPSPRVSACGTRGYPGAKEIFFGLVKSMSCNSI